MFYYAFASMKPAPLQKLVYRMELSHGGQFEAARYRWEFLRRNPEYCADYNEFMSCFGAWLLKRKGRWPHNEDDRSTWTKPEKKYYRTRVAPVLNRLRQKWQVSDLFRPEFGLAEWQAEKSDEGAAFPPTRMSDFPASGELKRMGFHGTGFTTRHYEGMAGPCIQLVARTTPNDRKHDGVRVQYWPMSCYKTEMPKIIEQWLLFKYVDGQITPQSKPFKTKAAAEKARLKLPEREQRSVAARLAAVHQ